MIMIYDTGSHVSALGEEAAALPTAGIPTIFTGNAKSRDAISGGYRGSEGCVPKAENDLF